MYILYYNNIVRAIFSKPLPPLRSIRVRAGQCESSKIQFAALHFLLLLFYYKDRLCAVAISIKFIPIVCNMCIGTCILYYTHTHTVYLLLFFLIIHLLYSSVYSHVLYYYILCFFLFNNNNIIYGPRIWGPYNYYYTRTPFLLCSFSPLPSPAAITTASLSFRILYKYYIYLKLYNNI